MKTRIQIQSICLCALTLGWLVIPLATTHAQDVESTDVVRQQHESDPDQTAADSTEEEKPEEEVEEYPLAELPPLRRLVLYNSGVGQLQHEGKVTDKQKFEIKFGVHDVDDVLKSLVFSDSDGGTVRAVEYQPAPEPEDVAANTLGMPMTLAQLVQRFRGEAVTLTVGNFEYKGTVYGVENRTEGEQTREMVVLIADEGLQSIELGKVDKVQFDKEELRTTLGQAMAGIVKSRKANQKKLELLLDGEGERDVRFAYVVDMPIWRMTYRLAIKQGKVYLQGWAHVDNITGVDWEQVELELRSGKPQSFHINVFAPLMAERPDFGNAIYEFTEGLILVTQWFGFEPAPRFGSEAGGGGLGGGGGGGFFGGGGFGGGGMGGGGRPNRSRRPAMAGVDIESAFRQAAQESRTAQLVRYVLDKPVDLGAGRSAALPVFSSEVPAKLISVFDEYEEGTTPFRAVEITNATNLSIVSGPVSIMRDGDFVGDGKLGRLDVDQKTEVVYGVDRAVEVTVFNRDQKPRLVSITLDPRFGIVTRKRVARNTIFRINNRDTEERNLVLYCASPSSEEETLAPAPESTTEDRARYSVNVDPRSEQEFSVAYEMIVSENKTINGVNARLTGYQDNPDVEMEPEVRSLFEKLEAFEDTVVQRRSTLQQLKGTKEQLAAEQTRVRDNLKVLTATPEAAKPFLEKIQAIEEEIESVNQRTANIQEELEKIAADQKQAIEGFFEK